MRVGRCLQRHGLLEAEHDDLIDAAWDDDPMPSLLGHAITYRIAVGPHQGRKVRMLQTLPADDFAVPGADGPGKVAGFSLSGTMLALGLQYRIHHGMCHQDVGLDGVRAKR